MQNQMEAELLAALKDAEQVIVAALPHADRIRDITFPGLDRVRAAIAKTHDQMSSAARREHFRAVLQKMGDGNSTVRWDVMIWKIAPNAFQCGLDGVNVRVPSITLDDAVAWLDANVRPLTPASASAAERLARIAFSKDDANRKYHKTGRSKEGSRFRFRGNDEVVRVDMEDPEDVAFYEAKGFVAVPAMNRCVRCGQKFYDTELRNGRLPNHNYPAPFRQVCDGSMCEPLQEGGDED